MEYLSGQNLEDVLDVNVTLVIILPVGVVRAKCYH